MAVSPVEGPLFACPRTGKEYQRGEFPPFAAGPRGPLSELECSPSRKLARRVKGGKEGFSLQRLQNHGLRGNFGFEVQAGV